MERRINRRQQGDLGEASAIEWLTSVGATVLLPVGHSPDFDLVAEANGRLLRVQVKTFDYLFVLTGDGRRWFIPSTDLEGRSGISLGGPKYSDYEIEPGRPIRQLVYHETPALESELLAGEYPSGQRMATVNRPAQPSQVRILPPPFRPRSGFQASAYDRRLGRGGQAIVNGKRRVTLPRQSCIEAGLQDGDRLRVRSEGDGRVVLERIEPPPTRPSSESFG